MFIAGAIALLNRIKTKNNYQKEQQNINKNFNLIKSNMNDFMLKCKL